MTEFLTVPSEDDVLEDEGLDDTQVVDAVRAIFQAVDSDNSGTLELDEVTEYIKAQNPTANAEEIARIMGMLDADGDEHVTFEEFFKSFTSLFDESLPGAPPKGVRFAVEGVEIGDDEEDEDVEELVFDEDDFTLSDDIIDKLNEMFFAMDVEGMGTITCDQCYDILVEESEDPADAETQIQLLWGRVGLADTDRMDFNQFVDAYRSVSIAEQLDQEFANVDGDENEDDINRRKRLQFLEDIGAVADDEEDDEFYDSGMETPPPQSKTVLQLPEEAFDTPLMKSKSAPRMSSTRKPSFMRAITAPAEQPEMMDMSQMEDIIEKRTTFGTSENEDERDQEKLARTALFYWHKTERFEKKQSEALQHVRELETAIKEVRTENQELQAQARSQSQMFEFDRETWEVKMHSKEKQLQEAIVRVKEKEELIHEDALEIEHLKQVTERLQRNKEEVETALLMEMKKTGQVGLSTKMLLLEQLLLCGVRNISSVLGQASTQLKEKNQEIKAFERASTKKEETINDLLHDVQQLNQTVVSERRQWDELRASSGPSLQESVMEADAKRREAEHNELSVQIQTLTEKLKKKEGDYKLVLDELNVLIKAGEEEENELVEARNQLSRAQAQLREKEADQRKSLSLQLKKEKERREIMEKLQQEVDEKEARYQNTVTALGAVKNELVRVKSEAAYRQKELIRIKDQLEEKTNSLNELRAVLEKNDEIVAALSKEKNSLLSQVGSFKEKLSQLDATESKVASLMKNIDELNASLKNIQSILESKEALLVDADKTIAEQQQKLVQSNGEVIKLNADIISLNDHVSTLSKSLRQNESQIREMEKELKANSKVAVDNESLSTTSVDADDTIWQSKVNDREQRIRKLDSLLGEQTDTLNRMQQQLTENNRTMKEAQIFQLSLTEKNRTLKGDLSKTATMLVTEQRTVEELRALLESKEKQFLNLDNESKTLINSHSSLQSQFEATKSHLEEAIETKRKVQAKLAELQQLLKERQEQIVLKENSEQLQQQIIDQLNRKLSELEEKPLTAELEAQFEEREKFLLTKETDISNRETEVKEQEGALLSMEMAYSRQQSRISKLSSKCHQNKLEIANLYKLMSGQQRLIKQYRHYRSQAEPMSGPTPHQLARRKSVIIKKATDSKAKERRTSQAPLIKIQPRQKARPDAPSLVFKPSTKKQDAHPPLTFKPSKKQRGDSSERTEKKKKHHRRPSRIRIRRSSFSGGKAKDTEIDIPSAEQRKLKKKRHRSSRDPSSSSALKKKQVSPSTSRAQQQMRAKHADLRNMARSFFTRFRTKGMGTSSDSHVNKPKSSNLS